MPDNRDLVRRQFGAHAQNYVTSAEHAKGESLDQLLKVVQPQPDWRVLDIATGGGHTALALAPHVKEVVAADLTPAMLAAAEAFLHGQGLTNVTFQEADATALPFADATFDLVTCRIAPHHFPDCARFVRETARVLRSPDPTAGKPGGLAAVVDNVVPEDVVAARHINAFEKLRDPSHHWAYAQADWLGFFAAAGFEVRHTQIFRKKRDLDAWAGRMGADEKTKAQLRVMLKHAPARAREALAPEFAGGKITFYLNEVLVVARR